MENFTAYNPVKLHFGKNSCEKLSQNASGMGKKALLIYGKGSIKTNGIYDQVVDQLKQANIQIVEFSGIKPNPSVTDARKAISKGISENVDLIIGVGGGSVIDSAKVIAACIPANIDPWDLFKGKAKSTSALPIISILTLAATGTEMNMFAVLQNEESNEKLGFGIPSMYPMESYLDPAFTLTVNRDYTAYGLVDLIAHSLENYFGIGSAPLSDKFVFAIVKEAIEIAPELLNKLTDYELRARMMWASTCALNGTTNYGRSSGDWAVHGLGHTISVLFDTPHGATLSIVYPSWLKFLSKRVPERIAQLGNELFGVNDADGCIEEMTGFFRSIGSPVSLAEAGITGSDRELLLTTWKKTKAGGYAYKIEEGDYNHMLNWI